MAGSVVVGGQALRKLRQRKRRCVLLFGGIGSGKWCYHSVFRSSSVKAPLPQLFPPSPSLLNTFSSRLRLPSLSGFPCLISLWSAENIALTTSRRAGASRLGVAVQLLAGSAVVWVSAVAPTGQAVLPFFPFYSLLSLSVFYHVRLRWLQAGLYSHHPRRSGSGSLTLYLRHCLPFGSCIVWPAVPSGLAVAVLFPCPPASANADIFICHYAQIKPCCFVIFTYKINCIITLFQLTYIWFHGKINHNQTGNKAFFLAVQWDGERNTKGIRYLFSG